MFSTHPFPSGAHRVRLAIGVAASTMAACASPSTTFRQMDLLPAMVTVRNDNWSDAQIYLISHSQKVRLGVVTAATSATFRVPRAIVLPGDIQLVAATASGDQVVTESITATAGRTVLFNVEHVLMYSTLLKRR